MVLFDTDILIWVQRGSQKAASWVGEAEDRAVSIQAYMELLQGARSRREIQDTKDFFGEFSFEVLPLTENIGHRASIYIEEYSAVCGMRVGDAIIAATAVENNLTLATGNQKHFRPVRDLKLKPFVP
ncbi:MAG: type II toxin-antitoxin system VapC family toxin [Candidatus Omnitrophica bacterium]|nr:type II toxin-antitoxin system VapC family toxin [Candidatus Omnitrophota bacterium]